MPKKGEGVPDSKSEKAREIIERFPNISKKELGRILFRENPLLFHDAEDGRSSIRLVTGAMKSTTTKAVQTDKYKGPLSIPRGELNDYSHHTVKGSKIGILCDVHLPYHDFDALTLAVEFLEKEKIDTLILDGDIIDCYQVSDYVRDPGKRKLTEEVEMLCHFIKDLQKLFPKIIYKLGNHEERYERYVLKKSPALWGFQCFEFTNLIKIEYLRLIGKPLDIDFVSNKRIIDIGNLGCVHGHEWGMSTYSQVNPARGYFLKARANVIAGDKHRTSENPSPDMNNKLFSAWSVGCLCDLHPQYRPLNEWNHGFAVVDLFKDGDFQVRNYKITRGRIV